MAGYRGPSIDHGLLSPSGHMSKRARDAALRREAERLFAGIDLSPTTPQPTESERLRTHAARLRELAARGMSTRKFNKEADRAESEAARIESES